MAGHGGPLREFDGLALYRAMDEQRRDRGLSWPGVSLAVWDLSADLHESRVAAGLPDHPIAAETIRRLGTGADPTCQHAPFYLRWLERSPESLLQGAPGAGEPLPACGKDQRPRWSLVALHAALAAARSDRGLSWASMAEQLQSAPSQLTGLRRARYGTSMSLAMRCTQWLDRPAADFIYPADW